MIFPKDLRSKHTQGTTQLGGRPFQNASGEVVGEATYTGSCGNTQGREFKVIKNPRPRRGRRIRKEEIMIVLQLLRVCESVKS